MCQHVALEVTICCAFVFTLIAAERLFSGMRFRDKIFQLAHFRGLQIDQLRRGSLYHCGPVYSLHADHITCHRGQPGSVTQSDSICTD